MSKITPQASSRHLFRTLGECGPWGQTLTSVFSTRVTLGQFLNCFGLLFSHLLNGEQLLLFSLVQCEDYVRILVCQWLRTVHSKIWRTGG